MKNAVFTGLILFSCFFLGCTQTPKSPAEASAPVSTTAAPSDTTAAPILKTTQTDQAATSEAASSAPTRSQASRTTTRRAEKQTTAQTQSTTGANSRTYTFEHLTLTLPDGFILDDSGSIPVAVPADYPKRADNITFVKAGADSIDNYTQESLEEAYRALLSGFIRSTGFETTKIDGVDAVKYAYEISTAGILQRQTQYILFGDTFCHSVTFTSVSGDFDEAFAKAAESIRIR